MNRNKKMTRAVLLSALGMSVAVADEVRNYGTDEVIIKFSEPVVSLGVVENGWNSNLPAADRGLNLFDITGDPQFTPQARWIDQDRLCLTFAKGCSVATKYRLAFRPGSDKYLSGAKMPQNAFEFSAQPQGLSREAMLPGIPGGAVCVVSREQITREQINFSPTSPVRYEFREVTKQYPRQYGKSVPATATEMRIKHLERRYLADLLRQPESYGLKEGLAGLESFTPEHVIPGRVIVSSAEPLDPAKKWSLHAIADDGSGFISGEIVPAFTPLTDLGTGISLQIVKVDSDNRLRLSVRFAAPVSVAAVEGIFRDMDICVGDTSAVTAEDGKSKTLALADKTLKFSLVTMPKERISSQNWTRLSNKDGKEFDENVAYELPYTYAMFVDIEGADDLPVTADVVLKRGLAAMLGQPLTTDHRHRITINAAAPVLCFDHTPDNPALLPLHGEHCLRLECLNQAEMQVSVAHLSAEQYAQHRELLKKIDETAAHSTAEITYNLQLLQKRVAEGIQKEADVKEIIKSYKRRLVQLKKKVPDYDALRKAMPDVSFGTTQKIDTAGQGIGVLKSAEMAVDLDALNGAPAGPGVYLVSVRSTAAPNVRAALRELGLAETLLDFETWYAVQLTDLHLTDVGNALMSNSVSTGAPTAEGKLLNITKGEPTELGDMRDGVTIVPNKNATRRKPTQLMLCSGDDYRTVTRYSDSPRMNSDRRILMLKDRPMYRPGDKVYLRGVLREVSHLGEPSMPHVKSVELVVSKPNRKELIRKKLKLNDYGAFDFEFNLPEGDEDIVGTYRVTVQADGNKYREEEYVECQEFRRDAFTAKGELKMDPVRPQEFTYTVTAQDLNGVPLSGAKAELEFELDYRADTPNLEGEKAAAPFLNDKEWKETLTLDAEGKATYTGKFDYLHRESLMNGLAYLNVRGQVVNDRQEYMRLHYVGECLYPADFRIVLGGRSSDNITLYSNVKDKEGKSEVLQREQTVNLRMVTEKAKEHVLPNGIILIEMQPVVLWQGDVTVPANAVNGVSTGLKERYTEFLKSRKPGEEPATVNVEIRGKDPSGRELQEWEYLYAWNYSPRNDRETKTRRDCTCKTEGRMLKITSTFENEGQATVVLNSVSGTRAAATVPVKKGENTWEIPLAESEYGQINVSIMLPVQVDGRFTGMEFTQATAEAERLQNKLAVEFSLPQQPARPGAQVTLSGRIVGADGKPLPATEVTLFAVDKGMLSVAGGHSVQNPGTFFTKVWVAGLYPQFEQTPAPLVVKFGERGAELLPGVWQGDIVGPGLNLNSGMQWDGGAVKRATRAMGGAEYQCAAPTVAGDVDCAVEKECAAPMACEAAPQASNAVMKSAIRSGSGAQLKAKADYAVADGEVPPWLIDADEEETPESGATGAIEKPRLRTNFVPVAVWSPALKTDAEGRFSVDVSLPDTLTTYQVYAVALAQDAKCFGYAEADLVVNQPVMLTPGTPLFMSVGDRLRLPLTITNNTDSDGTWTVRLEGADAPQQITLKAKSTSTLYFDYTAVEEGERKLHWEALAATGSDAVEGSFEVKFPAPVLREAHRLVLQEGAEPLKVGALPAAELATSTRGKVEVLLSANPLLHLNECMELTLGQGYGNTEWYATSLLPWMLHERMAPFSPVMAAVPAAEARRVVNKGVERLAKCQRIDGGMGYWPAETIFCRCAESSPWASAYAGLVLSIAQDNGYAVPEQTLPRLRKYLTKYLDEQRKDPEVWAAMSPHILYAAGRTLEDEALVGDALQRALTQLKQKEDGSYGFVAVYNPHVCYMWWFNSSKSAASLNFLAEMHKDKDARHESFLKWMRCVGHDYRHATTWDGGWMLLALHEYLRLTPAGNQQATVTLQDGQQLTLNNGPTEYTPAHTPTLGEIPTTIAPTKGTAYVSVKFRAQPNQTEYPGVTEKGLQVTRIYEKRGEDGAWRPATEFNVGDVVRVTLTCAKGEKDLEYFVLEDYLPSNMEALNPAIPSQSAGLEWQPWSQWFDNREFQAHRVRGFCTRWGGRDLLNMSYYARVKRAGEAMAPPASAQLMYEPQTYGLSPNTKVISK